MTRSSAALVGDAEAADGHACLPVARRLHALLTGLRKGGCAEANVQVPVQVEERALPRGDASSALPLRLAT
ncbi:MAG: hypothetical protein JW751_16770 [Polyangiaceae bacterium]|nr:hypothetical protein [Polyangiaceae bacterium]